MTNEAFGLISEKFARFMGTAQFLIGMTVFAGDLADLEHVGTQEPPVRPA